MSLGGNLVRANNMRPGQTPEKQSLRQHRQWWHDEIRRREEVDSADVVPLAPTSLPLLPALALLHADLRDEYRDALHGRRTVFHRRVRVRGADGQVHVVWRMPLMAPSADLTSLWPGRLEPHVSQAAHALVERQASAEAEPRVGRALFRARLLGYGFSAKVVDEALTRAASGAHVQLNRKQFGKAALLVDGVELAANGALTYARAVARES